MNLSVGIVGLPNVGKSTLFNALLKRQVAFVANYPFATIEPNIGVVPVPDNRLEKLAEIVALESAGPAAHSSQDARASLSFGTGRTARLGSPPLASPALPPIVPATVNFVDIAGLVKGASEGAGLGNKFLSHIREVSIIAHVVRAFDDPSASSGQVPIIKEGSIDPKTDYKTIQTELILADIATAEKVMTRSNKLKPTIEQSTAEKLFKSLNDGIPAREIKLTEEEEEAAKQLFLLSKKPEIVVLNVSESDYSENKIRGLVEQYSKILDVQKEKITVISGKIEAELSELSEEEQKEYLLNLGLKESGLERLIKKAYETLDLISFLTAGEKEVRAWTLRRGTTALRASSVIHTDFEKNFIKAEVVSFNDFVASGGWKKSREIGKTRFEGRDYIVRDGDVIEFKIGK
ncbi:MAG: redox-regulated ATPase YchF [Patescibacteria group bacterium]|nr:redox-regulated ATPase YchF [Patescibacteria group bacterium]